MEKAEDKNYYYGAVQFKALPDAYDGYNGFKATAAFVDNEGDCNKDEIDSYASVDTGLGTYSVHYTNEDEHNFQYYYDYY